VGSGCNQNIRCFDLFKNELYIGGTFSNAGGVSITIIAKWNGSTWSAVGGGANGYITAKTVFNESL